MNIDAMIEALPRFQKALLLTLNLALAGILLALLIGFCVAFINYFKVPVLKRVASIYVEISRNTPLLIQIFLLYYGLPKLGLRLNENVAAIIGLAFLGGGYMGETMRGGLSTIAKAQIESGQAIGLSQSQIFRLILLPQMFKRSLSDLSAEVMFLIKETSVFSAISIMDLTNVTRDLIGMFYLTKEYLLMLVLSYTLVLLPLALLTNLLEKRSHNVAYED